MIATQKGVYMEESITRLLAEAHREAESKQAQRFIIDVLCYYVVRTEGTDDETDF